ncbi:hypothetical protein HYH02_013422 [Chlamydomonas schloesseri]|uniref:Uncharacterized protein n=1 Tax=Chlamydomonas schloesseri TaxID=2026947 RepID=A0A835W038_9CHLO|nr:hypothetical protein HYH02_013422 [Chlamydomonas schloesseri]|eukprot:KAG2431291.1 hypothetical protein HYH02_013422 [Chlamydomonas schloesseri]
MSGTPLTERVVKSVGKTPAPGKTPGKSDVKNLASVPLPDDGDETEPFASSEDEQPRSQPTSPGPKGTPPPRAAAPRAPVAAARGGSDGGGGSGLFGFFSLTSILVTVVLALVLAPCADPELFTTMSKATAHYGPLCKNVVGLQAKAAELLADAKVQASQQARELHAKLPPNVQELLAKAAEPVQQAHAAALPLITKYAVEAQQRLDPIAEKAKAAWRDASRETLTRAAPLLEQALKAAGLAAPEPAAAATTAAPSPAPANPPPNPPAPKPVPITVLSLSDMNTIVEDSASVRQYLSELWDAAAVQVASKRKAVVWVLACRSEGECGAAEGKFFDAKSFYRIDGGFFSTANSAGSLQNELATYLRGEQLGLVLVGSPSRLHPNAVKVLNDAISEGGHLTQDGVPVVTHRALYVVLADVAGVDVHDEAAVKDKLCADIAAAGDDDDASAAIVRSFRRRIDAVLPAREDAGSGAPAFRVVTEEGDVEQQGEDSS